MASPASSPSNVASTPTGVATPLNPIVSLTSSKFDPHLVSVKLGEENFLPWREQALPTIRGYKLQKYILGSHVVPQKFVSPATQQSGNISEEFL